jgi:hypothetical protein
MGIEKTYNGFSRFALNTINTCISLLKIMVRSQKGISLPQAKEDSCIVLGNGPSLNTSFLKHPDFFKKYPLVCVNSFSVTDRYTELKPAYYVMLDPGFWLGTGDLVTNTINALRAKTSWPLKLLVPPEAKKSSTFLNLESENPNIKICYFNYTVFKGFENIGHFFYKKNLAMPQSQNVLVASIFLSVNIGFKNIYLFGADHSWHQQLHVNEENVLCFKNVHFYESEEKVSYKPFYKGVHITETFRMDEAFVAFGKTFYGYFLLEKYAKSVNATIYNASEISFIDAFKRIKL